MRLIDAEAFEKEMMNLADKYSKKRPRLALALLFATDIAKSISNYAEIIPKSAEWEEITQGVFCSYKNLKEPVYCPEIILCRCSLCKRKTVIKSNYCPNCGAKMKGEI